MQVTTFGAIYIGSYDVTLDIFEITKKRGVRLIDKIRKHIEIGTDTYTTGRISADKIEELCDILQDLTRIMKGYQVEAVRTVCASSIREADNNLFIMDRIRQETGLVVEDLSNSEQRFLNFKAIASSDLPFEQMVEDGAAIIDVGGGSIQISLIEDRKLATTLNLRIGSLRTRDRLRPLRADSTKYRTLVEEFISHEIPTFREIYLKDRQIGNVILNGDFITENLFHDIEVSKTHEISRTNFDLWFERIIRGSDMDLARELNIPAEFESLVKPTVILYHKFVEEIGAKHVYASNVSLTFGVAQDYAEKKKGFRPARDFNEDILSAARHLAKRYSVEEMHVDNVEKNALAIFKAIRKAAGLSERDRLLLRIAVILHEVGKYISLNNNGECGYQIIMNNEIIGLAHKEREIIALTAKFNTVEFPPYWEFKEEHSISQARYLKVAQFTAILRLANEMDRSHGQKVQAIRTSFRDNKLTIRADVNRSYALEQGLLREPIDFFREVFNMDLEFRVRRIV